MKADEVFLRKLYAEILLGHSPITALGRNGVIRHLTPIDQGAVDETYISFKNRALDNEIPSEKERLEFLCKEGHWTLEDEDWLENQGNFLNSLNESKKNAVVSAQIDELNKEILKTEAEIKEKRSRRTALIGSTAESFAAKKVNEFYIFFTIYKDPLYSEKLFNSEEFDDLELSELTALTKAYNAIMENVNPQNIKQIAISGFFQNAFYLCEDNVFNFYGKPVAHLSYYQVELASFGRFFKHVIKNSDGNIPEEVRDDPDKLTDWFHSSKSLNEVINKNDKRNVSIVGASSKDVGTNLATNNFFSSLKSKKTLGIEDLMALSPSE